jgi:phosphatidylserine decarboxylase
VIVGPTQPIESAALPGLESAESRPAFHELLHFNERLGIPDLGALDVSGLNAAPLPQASPTSSSSIVYIDRATGRRETEDIYGGGGLRFLYGPKGSWLLPLLTRPFVSWLYGKLQDMRWSARKVRPFIEKYGIDASEFLEPVDSFATFNQFFTRKLKPEARPVAEGDGTAILPADARYLFFPRIDQADGFVVKGQKFSLEEFLGDKALAARYEKGSMVIARLCPVDYHRFHFPAGGVASEPRLINGALDSVNPIALRRNIDIFAQNKRFISTLDTASFGKVLYVEVGATMVGRVTQTYDGGETVRKGQEKGYFSFGGSTVVLLFEPGRISFDDDLLAASNQGVEILARMGQSMGRAPRP